MENRAKMLGASVHSTADDKDSLSIVHMSHENDIRGIDIGLLKNNDRLKKENIQNKNYHPNGRSWGEIDIIKRCDWIW